ncbi:Clp protease N-terminal domain-containing protein [Sinorhizobium sp. RAC02]|uniref:Clp protease N-terminal domain-containing protein n=1 Tax=Sinorhizobium sp. RAC02 TaxID=1842534 RepID=UPI00083CEB82|nr:Clp protease N-terminal domain-containing protein [Sinorhizobium sp. RAC02]AOF91749.1 clp amino terminal domain protein [Sinorhizobium sp. RAC02]
MFNRIKARFESMSTIRALCEQAEQHARQDQQREPGAEHFMLAALDLPDGTARRAFEAVGADAAGFRPAIERQYGEALRLVGLDPAVSVHAAEPEPLPSRHGVFDAAPSGQAVMQRLAEGRKEHNPLLGAHVVSVVAGMPHGVAARTLRVMGIDAKALQDAADRIIRDVQG